MSEMVDRVAEILRDFQHRHRRNPEDFAVDDTHRAAARAAIETMREPTEAMVEYAHQCSDIETGPTPADSWHAMITEALK